jgi:tRNA pseudouridine13 synthase
MGVYATEGPPCRARIRVSDDDFKVTELANLEDLKPEDGPGGLPLYRLEKRGTDTLHAARRISKHLESRVSFGGMKDKRAVATQYLSPTSTRARRPKVIEEPSFRAELIGYVSRPFSRRRVLGNSFEITLRDACGEVEASIEEAYGLCRERRLPNFFGLQRFGTRDPVTHLVGHALVGGDFEAGIRYLLSEPRGREEDGVREAREMAASGMYREALRAFTERQDLERMAVRRLVEKPGDFLGAFRALPLAIRRFFVHAYQSYLFNRSLTKALLASLDISSAVSGDNWSQLAPDGLTVGEVRGAKEEPIEGALPLIQLVGYAYRDYGSRFDRAVMEVLEEEGVTPREFYVKDAQEVSAEGGFRRAPLTATGLGYQISGMNATLSFTLARGEYATTLLREILKPSDPSSTGF